MPINVNEIIDKIKANRSTDYADVINSLKGVSGSGSVLSKSIVQMAEMLRTMEPGDLVRLKPGQASSAPIAYDLWYLWYHYNFMASYLGMAGDEEQYDYRPYMAENLGFLASVGLKPLKVIIDLESQLTEETSFDIDTMKWRTEWANNGVYWINTIAWELYRGSQVPQYGSDGPKGFDPTKYIGYLTFPIGQLGVMEVMSILQETDLAGYECSVAVGSDYISKPKKELADLDDSLKPVIQPTFMIFPDMKDAGQNNCLGRHIIESGYLIPDKHIPSQNVANSSGGTAYAPNPRFDVEWKSNKVKEYIEEIEPKFWMRYWIHRDSTLPVPGEFIGILCKPVSCPPHVWWFQESNPIVYAGNWVDTVALTSGIITEVILEANRIDGKIGNQYKVKIQGCVQILEATDFLLYAINDRVAVLKISKTATSLPKSLTWRDMLVLTETDKDAENTDYVLMPATFYKLNH